MAEELEIRITGDDDDDPGSGNGGQGDGYFDRFSQTLDKFFDEAPDLGELISPAFVKAKAGEAAGFAKDAGIEAKDRFANAPQALQETIERLGKAGQAITDVLGSKLAKIPSPFGSGGTGVAPPKKPDEDLPSIHNRLPPAVRPIAKPEPAVDLPKDDDGMSFGSTAALTAFGSVAAGAGLVVGGFFALKSVTNRLNDSFENAADSIAEFSPEVTTAKFEGDMDRMLATMRRANEGGPAFAEFTRTKTDFDIQVDDLKFSIQKELVVVFGPVLKEITAVLKGVNAVVGNYDQVKEEIAGVLEGIKQDAVEALVGELSPDKTVKALDKLAALLKKLGAENDKQDNRKFQDQLLMGLFGPDVLPVEDQPIVPQPDINPPAVAQLPIMLPIPGPGGGLF